MRFTSIEVRAIGRRSAIPTTFYEIVRQGMDGILAPVEIILKSVQSPSTFLAWLAQAPESQQWTAHYHYVEPLNDKPIEQNEFLIRCAKRHPDGGRMKCNISLVGDQRLTSVRLDWGGRYNRTFAGQCLYDLQETLKSQNVPWDSIDILAEGYIREAHISEALLAAFEWRDGQGMLHKKGELHQFDSNQRSHKNQR